MATLLTSVCCRLAKSLRLCAVSDLQVETSWMFVKPQCSHVLHVSHLCLNCVSHVYTVYTSWCLVDGLGREACQLCAVKAAGNLRSFPAASPALISFTGTGGSHNFSVWALIHSDPSDVLEHSFLLFLYVLCVVKVCKSQLESVNCVNWERERWSGTFQAPLELGPMTQDSLVDILTAYVCQLIPMPILHWHLTQLSFLHTYNVSTFITPSHRTSDIPKNAVPASQSKRHKSV